ncbi:MAG: CBS domain-containing protein [Pseudomonadota bacterium]
MDGFESRRVGEIMIPLNEYPHLPVWSTLVDAIKIMHSAEIVARGRKSLPRVIFLFDLDGSIAGTVRRRDIMRGLEPTFLVSQPLEYRRKIFDVEVDANLSELSSGRVEKGIRERADRPVTDVMRLIETTIDFDAHIIHAVYEMVNNRMSILPVTQNKRVVGVIRTVDVFHELAEVVLG